MALGNESSPEENSERFRPIENAMQAAEIVYPTFYNLVSALGEHVTISEGGFGSIELDLEMEEPVVYGFVIHGDTATQTYFLNNHYERAQYLVDGGDRKETIAIESKTGDQIIDFLSYWKRNPTISTLEGYRYHPESVPGAGHDFMVQALVNGFAKKCSAKIDGYSNTQEAIKSIMPWLNTFLEGSRPMDMERIVGSLLETLRVEFPEDFVDNI